MKINENAKINQDLNNLNKENLFQRFSNKDQIKNVEKPVLKYFIINLNFFV